MRWKNIFFIKSFNFCSPAAVAAHNFSDNATSRTEKMCIFFMRLHQMANFFVIVQFFYFVLSSSSFTTFILKSPSRQTYKNGEIGAFASKKKNALITIFVFKTHSWPKTYSCRITYANNMVKVNTWITRVVKK